MAQNCTQVLVVKYTHMKNTLTYLYSRIAYIGYRAWRCVYVFTCTLDHMYMSTYRRIQCMYVKGALYSEKLARCSALALQLFRQPRPL